MKHLLKRSPYWVNLIILIFSWSNLQSQNVGIGINNPQFPLEVNGITWSSTLWGHNGRFNHYLRIGTNYDQGYKLFVDNGDTWLGGKVRATGVVQLDGMVGINSVPIAGRNLYVNGAFEATSWIWGSALSIANSGSFGNSLSVVSNATVGANLNVGNDGIVEGNFRVNGRVGINGATNSNYGLIVNNANSYFQGNTTTTGNSTVSGTVNASGNLTIKGNGHVRSNGGSNLRIGFDSRSFNNTIAAGDVVDFTTSITSFSNGNNDVRVFISQYNPDPDPQYSTWWPYFSMKIYDVDPSNNTCRIRVWNQAASARTLKGTVYLTTIAKD